MLRCLVYTRTSHKLRFPDPSPPRPPPPLEKKKEKKEVSENGHQSGFFWKLWLIVFEYDDVIHHTAHALWGMLSYFHLLGFWCGREKAIQVKPRAIWSNKLLVDSYFCENKGKNSPCWKIWGYVCTHSLPRRVRHVFQPHAWRTPKNVCVGG